MVQRKAPNKLGIQADHVKYEKRLGNLKKPSSCQHHDSKSRGPDMKKKMKRSRSLKLSDIEGLKSSPVLRKNISQPGKPYPIHASNTGAATPQKQLIGKTTGGSPNYMKSTSSSEARKERPQVSSSSTQAASDSKILRRRSSSNSTVGSDSGNRPIRTLAKTSSLKLVRTLTRTPSFKPVRVTTKKCTQVAVCIDMDIQRATCSSTLKDSKFPAYLMLNPGGTEAEGTSALKVCPYTYCSLNGHHHTPLPPLKCFLKARRRSLKAQWSMKMEVLSPRRAKLSGDGTGEIDSGFLGLSGDKHPENDLEEGHNDFFVEIYAKGTGNGVEGTEHSANKDDVGSIDFDGRPEEQDQDTSFQGGNKAAAEQDNKKQVGDSLPAASLPSEIDTEEYYDLENRTRLAETNSTEYFLEEKEVEDQDASYSESYSPEEIAGSFDSDNEEELQSSMDEGESIPDSNDMEWEEAQFSSSENGTEDDHLNKPGDEPHFNIQYLTGIKGPGFFDKAEIIGSDATASDCTEEILLDEELQELFEADTAAHGAQQSGSDIEIDCTIQNSQVHDSLQVTCGDRLSTYPDSDQGAYEDPSSMEDKGEKEIAEVTGAVTTLASMEESFIIQEVGVLKKENNIFKTSVQLVEPENGCTAGVTPEAWNDNQKDQSLQADDASLWLKFQTAGPSQHLDEICKVETIEDDITDQKSNGTELPGDDAGFVTKDEQLVAATNLSFGVPTTDSSQRSFGADQGSAVLTDGNSSQDLINCSCSTGPYYNNSPFGGENDGPAGVERQNLLEKDQDAANQSKIPTTFHSEEHKDSRISRVSSSGNNAEEIEKMEVDLSTMTDVAENVLPVNNGTSPGSGSTFLNTGSNTNQELGSNSNNKKWGRRSKKLTGELEELRAFNPREPNFLPVISDPEAEKVDLRHQEMDDRKNSEEWMLDYALRQAVNKLAPARKKKVALLVEAFETVLPIPKYENHVRHESAAFTQARPIQACS